MYYFESFDDAYSFLEQRGGYMDTSFMHQKPNESFMAYESRIFQTASRIHECLERYPREIYAYLRQHPTLPQYSFKELETMDYKTISSLRKSLGIKKRSSKKKVTSETHDDGIYQIALNLVQQTPTRELAGQIISNSCLDDEKERDDAILSHEEIAAMYGEDMPSLQELKQIGIVPEFPDEYQRRTAFTTDLNLSLNKNKKPRK